MSLTSVRLLTESHMINLAINGTPARIGDVWVHMKPDPRGTTAPYRLLVPTEHITAVFNKHGRKPDNQSLRDFILADIAEFGTFIMEGYLKKMREINGEDRRMMCVLATVDDVRETDEGIEMSGLIEEYCPERYLPKKRSWMLNHLSRLRSWLRASNRK